MSSDFSRRRFLHSGFTLLTGSALLGGGLLSACGDGGRQQLPSTGSGSNGQPVRGGRLRVGIIDGDQAGNLDAHKPVGGGTIRGWALYSKFWEWTENVGTRLALAEFAEPNVDASLWTIRIKPGLEFHHGKTITADDMVFSVLRLTDPKLASPFAGLVGAIDRNRVRKLDDRTIEIGFKEGQGFVPLDETLISFGGIVPTDYDPSPIRSARSVPPQELFPPVLAVHPFRNYQTASPMSTNWRSSVQRPDPRTAALRAGQIDLASGVLANTAG